MDFKVSQSIRHIDERGYLVEFLKSTELSEPDKPFGQIYFVTFEKPNQVRGNHYHTRFSEWFGVVFGTLQVILEDVKTKERIELTLSSDDKTFTRLTIGPYIAHAFCNRTATAVLLDYCNRPYDPKNPDRNYYPLLVPT